MRIEVRPEQLTAASAQLLAHSARLQVLLVVARLQAVADDVPGTQLAAAALSAADRLRILLARTSLQLAACGERLADAAQIYEQADAEAIQSRARQ